MGTLEAWMRPLRASRAVITVPGILALVASALLASATPAPAAQRSTTTIGGAALASTGLVLDAPGATPLPKISAGSFLLADLDTGEVLAARNPHGHLRPASTLKVLTALTVLPRLDPAALYTARWDDANTEGSRVGIVPDASYTVHQLFQGLFLQSGNDAASALANAAGGQRATVARMSTTARALGALDTSVRQNHAEPPSCRMLSAVASPDSELMSLTSTWAPAAANTRAVASPMPIAAPVTIATLPSSGPGAI